MWTERLANKYKRSGADGCDCVKLPVKYAYKTSHASYSEKKNALKIGNLGMSFQGLYKVLMFSVGVAQVPLCRRLVISVIPTKHGFPLFQKTDLTTSLVLLLSFSTMKLNCKFETDQSLFIALWSIIVSHSSLFFCLVSNFNVLVHPYSIILILCPACSCFQKEKPETLLCCPCSSLSERQIQGEMLVNKSGDHRAKEL